MRSLEFSEGEYYHVCNRGVDKRQIILDHEDADRFMQGLTTFNSTAPVGGLFVLSCAGKEKSVIQQRAKEGQQLVDIICYCLNPNHFHLLLRERAENGIVRLLQRSTMGYSKYFNAKYKRKGTLFSGPFRARWIEDNDDLLHTSAYVNLNDQVHQLRHGVSKLVRSSWNEYLLGKTAICEKAIILGQFKNIAEYKAFAEESLELILEKKADDAELEMLGVEL
ncbi:MAG: hypothetical protein A2542_03490 [Parcubacteria group bacterium RIFOXYD2_FULL_52_8]|nr:MAG: hypothetical protein A2542_03490 [Parcubacteria group bacterium RIFOXYD2_FULL_52_8]